MKEPCTEGMATHGNPESCVDVREDEREALTGARIGTAIELRNQEDSSADAVDLRGRPHGDGRQKQVQLWLGGVEEPAHVRKLHAREPGDPRGARQVGVVGRTGKAKGRKPVMNGSGKSDRSVVPVKPRNKTGDPVADVVEGRGLAKGNTQQATTLRTQSRDSVSSGLERVREVARRDRKMRFTALLHHVTVDRLRAAYLCLKRDAAVGVDAVTWNGYGESLEDNLQDLHARVHRGSYRAKPSRRAYIPKADGRLRPLGIASLEDKILQGAVVEVMNAIYEVDFLGFSYGFRPGRSQHHALDALVVALRGKVNWVLDADIRGFFDTIDHDWLMRFVEHRIADRRLLRLLRKWLKVGVVEEGRLVMQDRGTPQGATISPLLANIYLHYVLDLWVHHERRKTRGEVIIVRYADDCAPRRRGREAAMVT